MATDPDETREIRKQRREEHARRPRTTDDGTVLNPVAASDVLGDLEVEPIGPPPFSVSDARSASGQDKESTTVPEGDGNPSAANTAAPLPQETGPDAEAVFGTDSRKIYTPTTGFPNRAVCHLILTYPATPAGKAKAGTGCLIGPRHVLTAGHVLYSAADGGWAKTILVIPGRDGGVFPFGSEQLVWPNFKQRSVTGWTVDQDIDYDYGLITLNTGFSVGAFGLLYLSDNTLDSTTGYLIGYPGDVPAISPTAGTWQFGVHEGGALTDYDSTLVYYSMDTNKGQSGAGVYRHWNGNPAIFAVHGGSYDSDENRAARITKARYDKIRGWQQEDD